MRRQALNVRLALPSLENGYDRETKVLAQRSPIAR
jgi:hypothetical protein